MFEINNKKNGLNTLNRDNKVFHVFEKRQQFGLLKY